MQYLSLAIQRTPTVHVLFNVFHLCCKRLSNNFIRLPAIKCIKQQMLTQYGNILLIKTMAVVGTNLMPHILKLIF